MKTSNRPPTGVCATASLSLILNFSEQLDSGACECPVAVSTASDSKQQNINFRKIMFLLIGVLVKEPHRVGGSVGTVD